MTGPTKGKVVTVRGEVDAAALGAVLMHEHLHCDMYDWAADRFIGEERPAGDDRREYLMREAAPLLRQCHDYGCHGFVEVTPPPWRAWPDLYVEIAEAADVHIVLCTGFYREMEVGTYWVKRPEDRIWPVVVDSTVEQLAERCTREIVDGVHGTSVRAGAIKIGASAAELTELEVKTFRAAAGAQKATGVHITTHCTKLGGETSQLRLLDGEGVDPSRVVIGHAQSHLADAACREVCKDWMRRGANFQATNLGVPDDDGGERWRPLVEGIRDVFDAGLGDRLALGLDSGYCSESGPFRPVTFLPPSPFTHMFTHTLPAFRRLGLAESAIEQMLVTNPARILPVG